MIDNYILIGQTPVPCPDVIEWANWFENADRRVALTKVLGICYVSTVFLGLDHNFMPGHGRPILYESMAFWAGGGCEEQNRCSTWAQAELMHARMVSEVSRPAAVLGFALRVVHKFVRSARDDWDERWRELRGLGSRYDSLMEQSMERMKQRMVDREDAEWIMFG